MAAAATAERAVVLLEASGLTGKQQEVAAGLLSSQRAVDIFVAPAGAGKTFTITKYAEAHEAATGGKVTGLATSGNAAEVMRMEGLREAFTIADWLGKIKDSRETRGNLPVGAA